MTWPVRSGVVWVAKGGWAGTSRARSARVSSMTSQVPERLRGGQDAGALVPGHEAAGRIVEVRYQVGELRHHLTQGRFDDLDVPAGVGHRDRHGTQPAAAHRLQGVRVGRVLDHDPVTGPAQQPQDEGERVLGAGGHQDLFGHGGQSPPGEAFGDGGAQVRQAIGVVAGSVDMLGQLRGDPGERLGERLFRESGGGPGQVDRGVLGAEETGDAAGSPAVGQGRPGAGALAAVGVAALAEQVVPGGDGGPAGVEGCGQFPFGGEFDVQRNTAVQDESAHRPGQVAVGRPGPRQVGQQRGQLPAPQGPSGAIHPVHRPERMRVRHTTLPGLAVFPRPITLQTRRIGLEAHAAQRACVGRPERAHGGDRYGAGPYGAS